MPKLLPGETVVMRRHPHWIVPVRSLLLPVAVLLLVVILDAVLAATMVANDVKTVVTLAAIALLGGWAIATWLRWSTTSFTITDQRVILDVGILSHASKVIPIDRVQDVSTRQSIFGRLLGYGRVEIDAAGSQGAEVLDHLPAPGGFRDQVFMESERIRKAAASPGAPLEAPAHI
jgi:uncharacterized membrane protein YdbT with pleckstrin-like domain